MNSPHSYLINVVTQWKEFCKSHKNFEKAINEILSENQSLKSQNAYLNYRIKELENMLVVLKGGENNG